MYFLVFKFFYKTSSTVSMQSHAQKESSPQLGLTLVSDIVSSSILPTGIPAVELSLTEPTVTKNPETVYQWNKSSEIAEIFSKVGSKLIKLFFKSVDLFFGDGNLPGYWKSSFFRPGIRSPFKFLKFSNNSPIRYFSVHGQNYYY